MSTQAAILAKIIECPDEDTPRLAFADFLDDYADTCPDPEAARARAEFIRVQCELARMPPLPPTVQVRISSGVTNRTPALLSARVGNGDIPPDLKAGDIVDAAVRVPYGGQVNLFGAVVEQVTRLAPTSAVSDAVLTLKYGHDLYPGDRRAVRDLKERERELLAANKIGWFGVPGLEAVSTFVRGVGYINDRIVWTQTGPGGLLTFDAATERGFVHFVGCSAEAWLLHADAILAAHPVRRVRLSDRPTLTTVESDEGGFVTGVDALGHWVSTDAWEDELHRTGKDRLVVWHELRWPGIEFELPPAAEIGRVTRVNGDGTVDVALNAYGQDVVLREMRPETLAEWRR